MIFEVEGPGGKIIKVEGPEDATDDELIQIARSHVAQQKPVAAAPPVASQKSSVATNPDKLIPGQLPELSPQKDLSKQVQQKSTEEVAQPVAQAASPSMFESLGKGNFGEAWKSIPEDTRNMIEYGTLPVLGVAALAKAAKDYYNSPPSIKARTIGNGNPPAPATSSAPPTPSAPPAAPVSNAPPAPNYSPKEAKLAQDIENKYGYKWSDIKSNFGVSDVSITSPQEAEMMAGAYHQKQKAPTVEPTPVTPAAEVIAPVETTKASAPPPVEAPKAAVAPEIVEAKLGTPTKTTGSGMPAYEGQGKAGGKLAHKKGTFESLAQVPKDYVFVPGGQSMDIVRNAVGQPEYTKNLKSSGGYPSSPQAAYEQSRNINKSLGRVSMSEAKAAGALPEPTPSITQKIAGSKAVRVGGVTGALILATDLASAAQEGAAAAKQGDRQMATGYLTDIIGALSGPIGFTASQILGTSPEELKTLREAEQRRKVGAGRGIAPPSAYQR
jgi:hypothetical protein